MTTNKKTKAQADGEINMLWLTTRLLAMATELEKAEVARRIAIEEAIFSLQTYEKWLNEQSKRLLR